jgi:cystathionine beta-lyase
MRGTPPRYFSHIREVKMNKQSQFDVLLDRRNTNSLKWDVAENELPLWVADMDFATAPAVTQAILQKAQLGIFGYQIVPDVWYNAYIGWWQRRHNLTMQKEWLCFCTGVIPAITSCVKRLTNVGDNVVLQTPVYNIFFHSVKNTGRHVLENELVYENGAYTINFDDLEKKLSLPTTTLLIICNPHNPVGTILTKEQLARMGSLCKKYGVTALVDEIHCDITEPNTQYVPFLSVSEECKECGVICISASKAFNLAGLQSAAVCVPNEQIRNKVVRGLNSDEVAEPNAFAVEATVAAFTQGEEWLDELRVYISQNRKLVADFLQKNLPDLKLVKQNATYLLWIDCSAITDNTTDLCKYIRKTTGLYITAGAQYHGNGKQFVRINVACPRARLSQALTRFHQAVISYPHA